MQQERKGASSVEPQADDTVDRPKRELSPAARRALDEAEARRRQAEERARTEKPAREIGGRGGKDPARYGDWEIKGRAIDF